MLVQGGRGVMRGSVGLGQHHQEVAVSQSVFVVDHTAREHAVQGRHQELNIVGLSSIK